MPAVIAPYVVRRDRRAPRARRCLLTGETLRCRAARASIGPRARWSVPASRLRRGRRSAGSSATLRAGARRSASARSSRRLMRATSTGRMPLRRRRDARSPRDAHRRAARRGAKAQEGLARLPREAQARAGRVDELRMFSKILIANRGEIACRVITHRAPDGHRAPSRCTPTPTRRASTCARPTRRCGSARRRRASRTCAATRSSPRRSETGAAGDPPRLRLPVRERGLRRGLRGGGRGLHRPARGGDPRAWARSRRPRR